eukprot:212096-Chlamydomonas_euryale.AAC.2
MLAHNLRGACRCPSRPRGMTAHNHSLAGCLRPRGITARLSCLQRERPARREKLCQIRFEPI